MDKTKTIRIRELKKQINQLESDRNMIIATTYTVNDIHGTNYLCGLARQNAEIFNMDVKLDELYKELTKLED